MSKPYPVSAFFDKAEVNFLVPSTVEEGDTMIGETGAILEEGIDNIIYRHTLPNLYKKVSAVLAATDGDFRFRKAQATNRDGSPMIRNTKSKGVVPVLESNTAHLTRFYDSGTDEQKAALVALLQSTASTIPFFDKTEPSAARGPAKVSKGSLDAANGYVAAGVEKVEKVVGFIENNVPGYKVLRDDDGSVSTESLGRAIDALGKYEQQKAKAARDAALASLG